MPGHYNVTVNCSNPDDSVLYWNIIHIQRPVKNISFHVETPKPANLTFEFQIDPGESFELNLPIVWEWDFPFQTQLIPQIF